MARRKVAYRRQHQNRFSMFLVTLAVLMILVVVAVRSVQIQETLTEYEQQLEELDKQITKEDQRTGELVEYRKYTQTKKFAEEVAKDKLGLVYEDEILFKQE